MMLHDDNIQRQRRLREQSPTLSAPCTCEDDKVEELRKRIAAGGDQWAESHELFGGAA